MIVDEAGCFARLIASEEAFVAAAMIGEGMGNLANQGKFVGNLGMKRQQFANLYAGDVAFYRAELAAILGGSIRFGIIRFQVGRPAWQPEEDHRRVRRRPAGRLGRSTQAKEIANPYSSQRECAETQEITSRKRARTEKCVHGRSTFADPFVMHQARERKRCFR